MNRQAEQSAKNRKTVLILSGLVVGMFAFGFALVPLYNLYCKAVGINNIDSTPQLAEQASVMAAQQPQLDREVTVKFDVNVRDGLPWDFEALDHKVTVHPGEKTRVMFRVRNRAAVPVTGQAIPAVTPWEATPYLAKLECFCFNKQELLAGEVKEMPLYFMVSQDLPDDIEGMVLSYTFMNASKMSAEKYGKEAVSGQQVNVAIKSAM